MKKILKNIAFLMLMSAILPLLSGCNNEYDVIEIFTGKTWKLSFISAEDSHQQYDYWKGNEDAREKSMALLGAAENFTLNFEGTDLNGDPKGVFSGKAVLATIDGTWKANAESRELNLSTKTNRSETDVLAQAFVFGLKNAFKYEGDTNNLFIYYKEGQTVKRIGLKPVIK